MKVAEPRPRRSDLRWRLFGVPIRVDPLFWVASAVLGLRFYADPEAGSLGWFLFWMTAIFLSILLHEFGHVLVGRLFGVRMEVVLFGLGGLPLGVDAIPRRWQRVTVLLGGPLAQIILVAGVWGLTFVPFPAVLRQRGWEAPIATGAAILIWINYYWALLNLVPLWPFDGGRVACEIGEWLFGVRGISAALTLCLVASGILAGWVTLELSLHLNNPLDPRYLVWLAQFSIWLLFCFLLWMRAFRALFPQRQDS